MIVAVDVLATGTLAGDTVVVQTGAGATLTPIITCSYDGGKSLKENAHYQTINAGKQNMF